MEAKIFINTDEEISFIAEKIKDSAEKNIALVVPDRALLLSSLPSLKLLKKQMIKQGKKIIIVSMDEGGRKLAMQAGITTVPRITELKSNMWSDENSYSFDAPTPKPSSLLQKEHQTNENENVASDTVAPVTVEDVIPPVSTPIDLPVIENKIEQEPSDISPPEEKPLEFHQVLDLPQVNNDFDEGLSFVVGHDINEFKKTTKLKSENVIPRERKIVSIVESNTQHVDETPTEKISKISPFLVFKNKIFNNSSKVNLRDKKLPIIIMGLIFLLLIFTGIYAYYIAPKADIIVMAQKYPINVSQLIYVSQNNKDITTVGDKIYVPSYTLTSNPQRASLDTASTGSKITGTAAVGQIEVMNISTSTDVNVRKGSSIFTCRTGSCAGLTYLATDNATLPKQVSGKTTSIATVNVVASDIGDKFNFNFPTINTFDLSGFEINTVNRNIDSFTGGATKKIKVVNQSDIDSLKKQLIDQTKDASIADLKTGTTGNNILIDTTIVPTVTDQSVDFPVGAASDRVKMSLIMTATAQGFKKSDLQTVTNQIIKSNQKQGFEIESAPITFNPTIQEKVNEGQKVNLMIQASQKPILDKNTIITNVKGKSVPQTEKYLSDLPGVIKSSVVLKPGWAPGFLKHIPFTPSNINLNLDIK